MDDQNPSLFPPSQFETDPKVQSDCNPKSKQKCNDVVLDINRGNE